MCQFTPSFTLLRLNPDIRPHWLPNEVVQVYSDQPNQPDQGKAAKPTEPARATTGSHTNSAKPPWECRITGASHHSQL